MGVTKGIWIVFTDKTQTCSVPHSTGKALTFIKEKVLTWESGMRKNVPKVLVVVTDGRSQDEVKKAALVIQQSGKHRHTFDAQGLPSFILQFQTSRNACKRPKLWILLYCFSLTLSSSIPF